MKFNLKYEITNITIKELKKYGINAKDYIIDQMFKLFAKHLLDNIDIIETQRKEKNETLFEIDINILTNDEVTEIFNLIHQLELNYDYVGENAKVIDKIRKIF